MDKEQKWYGGGVHVLAIPYPTQGHINPMLQFCKRLVSKGLIATLAITTFISNTTPPHSPSVHFDTISDGYDRNGFKDAESVESYLTTFKAVGSKTLAQLIHKHKTTDHPINCVIYDAFIPWALDVAKEFGLVGAAFFTQTCAVNFIYYCANKGLLTVPVNALLPVSIPGLPTMELSDMPSFIYKYGSYPAYFELVLNQFVNVDRTDYMLLNTFYHLEDKVVQEMSKLCPVMTIGPTVPSFYLDQRVENDMDYGLNIIGKEYSSFSACKDWLTTKPAGSVVYVSFGSLASLSYKQLEELVWGLYKTNKYFLLALTTSVTEEEEVKLSMAMTDKGLRVRWSPQLEVLSHEAVGCFVSHCGWNSTLEALSLGVPMVGIPLWTDQTTNAKLVEDVWRVGVRVKVGEDGIVGRDEIKDCVMEVMEGERGREMMNNAMKWRHLAKEAVSEGGTSDININEFASQLMTSKSSASSVQ